MITLQAAIDKLSLAQAQLSDSNIWKSRITRLINHARTSQDIDTVDEFCDAVEGLSIRNLDERLSALWEEWYG